MPNTFFTSDPHYGHKNIIKYSNRPFEDVIQMNEALIANFNAVVQPDDTVWMQGDISFMAPDRTERVLKRLNGHKHLIFGNHDKTLRKNPELLAHFESVQEFKEIDINVKGKAYHIVLCHYPLLTWNRAHHGSFMLHGHCHGNVNHLNEKTARLDVGVDVHNYFPVSIEQVIKIMEKKQYEVIDHHGKKDIQEEM